MVARLILRNQSIFQLIVAVIGSLFGLLLLLASLQLYIDFRDLLTNKTDLISSQMIIINKQVSVANTLGLSNTTFSKEEIADLKKVKSVENVGAFQPNLFKASAYVKGDKEKDVPGFYSELFFEAIPDEFLDVKSERWKWNEGDTVIPIVVPADYMNLYNFGFAPSQGLPQISKKTVEAASFRIKIDGRDGDKFLTGKIAGFTERINSILIPQKFLDYANKNFGTKEFKGPSRLIVVSSDASTPELLKYLDANAYETNSENLKSGKLASVLRIITGFLLLIGAMIIALSLLSFIQYSQLMISRSQYQVRTLIQIGYYHWHISIRYILFYVAIFIFTLSLTLLIIGSAKKYFFAFMEDKGYELNPGISSQVYLAGIILLSFYVLLNSVSIFRNVYALAKPAR